MLVDQFSIITYRPEEHGVTKYTPFGTGGKNNFSYEGYVVGFYGRSGEMLDSLGVYHLPPAKKSPVFGYAEEPPNFDQNPDTGYYPPVVKIRQLIISHGIMVYSIQAQYKLKGGAKRLGVKLGGDGINSNTLLFDDDEEILGINGTSATRELCKLMFISRKHNTSNPVMYHGPFGGPCLVEEGKNFSGNVLPITHACTFNGI